METTFAKLETLANEHGVTISWHKGGAKAVWLPERQLISLRVGMSDVQTLCTLAHELGHAALGHSGKCPRSPSDEAAADRWAIDQLISSEGYRLAEIEHDTNIWAIAEELGVTTNFIHLWKERYQRA